MDALTYERHERRKKKKKKIRLELSHDLLYELYLRFPIKKLLQIMCVSKSWFSIIRHPTFLQIYRRRNPGALIVVTSESIYYSTLGHQYQEIEENFVRLPLPDTLIAGKITNVVNGLSCFHNSNSVFVYHIWTGEIMRLPSPASSLSTEHCRFFLGFDQTNRVYKLLKLTRIVHSEIQFEILTLGTSSWRKLYIRVPNCFVRRYDLPLLRCDDFLAKGIVFFWDFSTIYPFSFIEEKLLKAIKLIHNNQRYFICGNWMARKNEQLTLYDRTVTDKLILRVLNNHSWIRHEINLPEELERRRFCFKSLLIPLGNLSTGELLLANDEYPGDFIPVYAYDVDKNKFVDKFMVGKLPDQVDLRFNLQETVFASLVELNFSRLKNLISIT